MRSLHLLGDRQRSHRVPSLPPAAGRAWVSAPFAVTRRPRSDSRTLATASRTDVKRL